MKNIRLDIGDHVREGELLPTLEVPELKDEMAKATEGTRPHRRTSLQRKARQGLGERESRSPVIPANPGCIDEAAGTGAKPRGRPKTTAHAQTLQRGVGHQYRHAATGVKSQAKTVRAEIMRVDGQHLASLRLHPCVWCGRAWSVLFRNGGRFRRPGYRRT